MIAKGRSYRICSSMSLFSSGKNNSHTHTYIGREFILVNIFVGVHGTYALIAGGIENIYFYILMRTVKPIDELKHTKGYICMRYYIP